MSSGDKMTRILNFTDMAAVEVIENGEPLVRVSEVAPGVLIHPGCDGALQHEGEEFVLRKGAACRLAEAQRTIEEAVSGATLVLMYAYRHPVTQQRWFDEMVADLRPKHPGADLCALREMACQFVAAPEVAGHPTGGAVDVTIMMSGKPLDMGTLYGEFSSSERIKTFSTELDEIQRKNRLFLRDAMLAAGFAPFNGEWWHFSYGDREWAAFYEQPHAIYAQVDFALERGEAICR